MNANAVVRQLSVRTDWGGGGYKWRAQSNSSLGLLNTVDIHETSLSLSTLLKHFQCWINTGMVCSDTFSVEMYVRGTLEKNHCKSINFEAKHIFHLSFVSTSCGYWVQKRITLIHSWCMQFFMVTKGHKKYGLELREENTCTKILQSEIKTWLYL